MKNIIQDLYQHTGYIPAINLTFHQYLLDGEKPFLVHTGNARQVETFIPALKNRLAGRQPAFVFMSHFESDECGGLPKLLSAFPGITPIASEVTARELSGFGLAEEVVVKKPGERLVTPDGSFLFIRYPSEMHLWDGLLVYEERRKILFSSDLMLKFGGPENTVVNEDFTAAMASIRSEQIPDEGKRRQLQETLKGLDIAFIATGHGPCIHMTGTV